LKGRKKKDAFKKRLKIKKEKDNKKLNFNSKMRKEDA
jgi:hypothetical protein